MARAIASLHHCSRTTIVTCVVSWPLVCAEYAAAQTVGQSQGPTLADASAFAHCRSSHTNNQPDNATNAAITNNEGAQSTRQLQPADNEVILSADSANSDPNDPEQIILNGTIDIRHIDGAITAEDARYDTRTQSTIIDGELSFESNGLRVNSENANIKLDDGTFELGESGYELDNQELISRGRAQSIDRNQEGELRLKGATYTSCPEGDNGWLISSDSISLNPDEGIGTARDITLRFKDVPIFYAPFFSFPLGSQRKTGLLAPRIDQNDTTGLEYRQPFYWNIRPDTDATFTTRAMSARGLQLQSEFRHLNHIGLWTVNHEFISNDNRHIPGVNRHFTRLRHLGGLSSRWSTAIDISNVSDGDYFEDLGDTLNIASITHLQRRGDITYAAENYVFRTRLLSYQTVDESIAADERPYQQLPQLTFDYRKSIAATNIDATIDSELVYFDRDNSITGARLDIEPKLEWNLRRAAWYSTIGSSVRHTRYDLDQLSSETRTVPIFSAEGGMFFDRINEPDGSVLTLEPRLYYLYARRTEQSQIPVFDSGALDFNFSQLFRENRFSGADRVNDANQLTLALSSRRLNKDGRETFQASIGQIQYFEDRTVTLPGEAIETTSGSDVVAEMELEFDQNWTISSALQWNTDSATTERSSAAIRYRNNDDRLFNIGHRFLDDEGEFINASFAWPVSEKWRVAAGWNYSLDDKVSIESVLGIEYEDCCWAFRTAARRFIADDGQDQNTGFFFQLVLKGLAPVGQNVTEVLREAVGGYTSDVE